MMDMKPECENSTPTRQGSDVLGEILGIGHRPRKSSRLKGQVTRTSSDGYAVV
jgi:hypothetical protein